jgi:hypothetical protein
MNVMDAFVTGKHPSTMPILRRNRNHSVRISTINCLVNFLVPVIREGTVPLAEWISDWEGTPEKEKSCLQYVPESR